ncbi:hypothetical protein RclHR1_02390007 [Rhizophagus clarus]|uniref:Dolichol phosphate-mannose biosynthesis regulatory protein n=1 Tax=Rhizophagus clarus TaxID=94130 RepID=A0A2Z6RCB7_9GLOM|nr:hypothetical protein RclHR1_02390007 [Rhizophagus clarus]
MVCDEIILYWFVFKFDYILILHIIQASSDKAVGATLLLTSVALFLYYTIWALIMPFVDDGHPLHEYFPDRSYAIRIPVVLLLFGLTVVFTFLALVMIKSNGAKKNVKKA